MPLPLNDRQSAFGRPLRRSLPFIRVTEPVSKALITMDRKVEETLLFTVHANRIDVEEQSAGQVAPLLQRFPGSSRVERLNTER